MVRRRETPAELEGSRVKVADATTQSFEAYQHYFRGDQLKEAIRYVEAIAEYRKAIAIDPNDSSVVWVGTGENSMWCEDYFGVGLLRSMDGGRTWIEVTPP